MYLFGFCVCVVVCVVLCAYLGLSRDCKWVATPSSYFDEQEIPTLSKARQRLNAPRQEFKVALSKSYPVSCVSVYFLQCWIHTYMYMYK